MWDGTLSMNPGPSPRRRRLFLRRHQRRPDNRFQVPAQPAVHRVGLVALVALLWPIQKRPVQVVPVFFLRPLWRCRV